jgi:hypothetical protein
VQVSHEIDHDKQLVITIVSGRFDLGELGIQLRLLRENAEISGFSRLLDFRQAEVDHFSSDDAEAYGAILVLPAPPNIAILVSNDVQRRLATAFHSGRYLNGTYSPFRVFEQLDEALDWLKEQPAPLL